jgi:8-oxo-dGTP pyrophosphatase MutT (NUDIX family)
VLHYKLSSRLNDRPRRVLLARVAVGRFICASNSCPSARTIRRRVCSTAGSERDPHFLLLDYGKHWDYAKGHVKKGEDDLTAARRELDEETGIADADFDPDFRHEMTYFFRDRKKGLIKKTVAFFLAKTDATKATVSHEHVAAEFLPYEKAVERVTYANAKEALRAAKAFLDAHRR